MIDAAHFARRQHHAGGARVDAYSTFGVVFVPRLGRVAKAQADARSLMTGRITDAWQLMGGYAWQTGEITTTQSATAIAGNTVHLQWTAPAFGANT